MSSPLELLPCELALKIFSFLPFEAVFDLMTSHALRSHAKAYARVRACPRIVDHMFIERTSPSSFKTTLSVVDRPKKWLELRFKVHAKSELFLKRIRREQNAFNPSSGPIRYIFAFDAEKDEEGLVEYVRDCVGVQIDVAELFYPDDRRLSDAIMTLIGGIKFDLLKMSFDTLSDLSSNILINTVISHNVQRLCIYVGLVTISDSEQLLLDISLHVRSLFIHQSSVAGIERDIPLFLGAQDIDWVPIFLRLYEGKLNKLMVDNRFYKNFLSSGGYDALRKQLPQLGKKMWFAVSCDKYDGGLDYFEHEHLIYADASTLQSRFLRVKHLSRRNEDIMK